MIGDGFRSRGPLGWTLPGTEGTNPGGSLYSTFPHPILMFYLCSGPHDSGAEASQAPVTSTTLPQPAPSQASPWVGPGKPNLPLGLRGKAGVLLESLQGQRDLIEACIQDLIFLSREDRDLGFPFQTPRVCLICEPEIPVAPGEKH